MSDPQLVISNILNELQRARTLVQKRSSRQITKSDDRDFIKSIAYSWFRTHRTLLLEVASVDFTSVDTLFQTILLATDHATLKITYINTIKDTIKQIQELRAAFIRLPSTALTSEQAPDFTPLAADVGMRTVLFNRWIECQRCIKANAHLAATVMMGGLLEALFVARANAMIDKAPLFKTKLTPLDLKTKKPLPLKEWTLRPYIDVAHELGWITKSGKDIAVVLRDYRNLIHPEKQRALGITLNEHDSLMFWEITKSLSKQLLSSP